MATITSTIRLVDQMTPTLNKISKAIDNVNRRSKAIGSTTGWTNFVSGAERATKSTHNFYNALRRAVFLLGTLRGLQGSANVADTMMNATARINNINDGLYTTSQYLDIIYSSAQRSRGSFLDMSNSVGKLGTIAGDAFGSVNEMIAFTELMNKLFVISGASAAESSNAMYQLTQAMAAGKLQGDEMRSILENAPLLAQKIADKLGVTKGEIKELGAKGKITADVIKEALFDAADDIEDKFNKMPKTIGQTWTEIKNYALNSIRPVITAVQNFINSPMFESFKNRLFSIITSISNAVIRLFELMETPRIQNAISKICTAFSTLWDIAVQVGTVMVNVAIWVSEHWSWIAPILAGIVGVMVVYKVVSAICAVVSFFFSAGLLAVSAAGAIVTTTFGWIVLIIFAVIAAIYLAVAAWNYFTGQTVSATGIIFGAIAFVVSSIIWLVQVAWSIILTLDEVFNTLGEFIWQIGVNIWNTFEWVGAVIAAWALNVIDGMSQLCSQLPLYWEKFKESTVVVFWSLVVGAGRAFNNMLKGASDIAKKMVKPFENFVNSVIGLLNKLIGAWNGLSDKLTISVPNNWITQMLGIGGEEIRLVGNHVKELGTVSWTDWGDPTGINLGGATSNLTSALGNVSSINSQIKDINWNTNPLPEYGDYVDWSGSLGKVWDDYNNTINGIWAKDFINVFEVTKDWYNKGADLENGVSGLVDGIGALLDGLFNKDTDKKHWTDKVNDKFDSFKDTLKGGLPDSLDDLLRGYGGGAAGSALDDIGKNTGSTASSVGNIEDTLDLAEEELELLRKIAEQEIINRFTTAEIKVDMTNNNNINSKTDLDSIVTHLSNKLYEELGVVANGVHY